MARVVVTETAKRDLDSLITTRGLPASTPDRVRALLTPLATRHLVAPHLASDRCSRPN